MRNLSLLIFIICLMVKPAFALDPQPDALFVRVLDVGAGMCCVVKMPGDHYLVYDAGNYEDSGRSAIKGIGDLIPKQATIDLLVLSHTDSDHVAGVASICDNYTVKRIIHPGLKRYNTWMPKAYRAINREVKKDHAEEFNLAKHPLSPGKRFSFGDVTATFICGFSAPPAEWEVEGDSEFYNAGSVILRIEYKGKSILLCGDSVGRHIDDPIEACIAGERFAVDHAVDIPIASDVLVAPHHGADNGSSTAFIRTVHPRDVIFSAGHKFYHPRAATAQRYINAGISDAHLFRTDRGDHEGGKEWNQSGGGSVADRKGDDDVDVMISKDGNVTVAYRNN